MKRILHKASIFLIGVFFMLSMFPMESKAQTTTTYMTASSVSYSVVHTHSSSSGTHDGTACWAGSRYYNAGHACGQPLVTFIGEKDNGGTALCAAGHGHVWSSANGATCGIVVGAGWVDTRVLTDSTYNTSTPFVSMTLSCSDIDAYDGKAILTADISEGGYFEKWAWSDDNKVVWSSASNGGGTIYGYGTNLEITTTGTYYCTLLGDASGFTISGKSSAITVNGTNVNVSKIFVGNNRIREFNKDTYAYDKTIRIGDVVISKIYIGDTLIHDDSLYR